MSEIKTLNGFPLADTTAREGVRKLTEEMAIFREITESDNGKFLRVVDGEPQWESVPNAEEASF